MTTNTPYPRLFEPGRIGSLEVPNRVCMAAMLVGFADPDGRFSQRHIDYFAARAEGGAGLIFTESVLAETEIQQVPEGAPVTVGDNDMVMPRLQELTRAVHRHGSKIAFQVSPGEGRQSHVAIERRVPRAPSAIPAFLNPSIECRALDRDEIKRLAEACGEAALRAALAGFDMIDIHAHTGYLIDQFMSPLWNRRDDEYGGDFEGLMRFPLEVIASIRARVGERFPLGFRLTAEHRVEGGRTVVQALEIARRLEAAGIDLLTVDAGCYEVEHWMIPPVYLGDACLVDLATAVREVVSIPVAATGSITRPEQAEEVIASGKADFVSLGRSFLADPQWAKKAQEGRVEEIRPCILCNEYCMGRIPAACMVNPAVGREAEYAVEPTAKARRVVVVGGGPGGLEAARVAASRGHQVTLFERQKELGGQLVPAGDAVYKRCLHALKDQMALVTERAGVEIELGQEIDADALAELSPDVVVVATGAEPERGRIPGADQVLDVFALHGGEVEVGEHVIVAGGGLNGSDAALDLALAGKKVTLVDRHDQIGRDLNLISRGGLEERLRELGVEIRGGLDVLSFTERGLIARDRQGEEHRIEGDTVLNALGVRPVSALANELRQRGAEVRQVGDCVSPRKIGEAIHEGFKAGLEL